MIHDFEKHYGSALFCLIVQAFRLYAGGLPGPTPTLDPSPLLIIELKLRSDLPTSMASGISARKAFLVRRILLLSEPTYLQYCLTFTNDPAFAARLQREAKDNFEVFASHHRQAVDAGAVGWFRFVLRVDNIVVPHVQMIQPRNCKVDPIVQWPAAFAKLVELGKGSRGMPLLASEKVIAELME